MKDEWQTTTIGELCDFSSGYGFRPTDWAKVGLPIIRIQNLNGSPEFNYYAGEPRDEWLVEPGTLLFAWAGSRGVSFGPTIWRGPRGVLNQHIYRIKPRAGVDPLWLYAALQIVTRNIERKAHGFKATLVHVRKEEITGQVVALPPLPEQKRIVEILAAWDKAIRLADQLAQAKRQRKHALMQRLLSGRLRFPGAESPWTVRRAGDIFQPVSKRNNGGAEELLSVTQEQGVLPRSMLETRVVMPAGETQSYKLVEPGDFIISLRSFQGGIEYSEFRGLVSPAYTVLKPRLPLADGFYRQLFKSPDFIARLGVAIIGIRDGKQINFDDFAGIRLAYPTLDEQRRISGILHGCDDELALLERKTALLMQQKQGITEQLLKGKVRAAS